MHRVLKLSAISAVAASMMFTMLLGSAAGAAPGDTVPDLNIKPAPGDPPTVSQVSQATWQTNGIVWAMETVGNVVYVGGNFTKVRPPGAKAGQQEQARKNMAAFDAKTGALLPFSHNFTAATATAGRGERPDSSCTVNWTTRSYTCDTVYEIRKSPDGKTIYVGGDFTKVDDAAHSKLAAFNVADNSLNATFKPAGTDRRVRSLAVSDSAVYAGGIFTKFGGQARNKLAAFNRTNGALLPWAPKYSGNGPNGGVIAMTMSPDKSRVILAGEFSSINGRGIQGLDAVNASDGTSVPWEWRGIRGEAFGTDVTTDADTVYATAESRTTGGFEGRVALDPNTGRARWVDTCKGATWSVAVIGKVLYSGSHAHDCSDTRGGFDDIADGRNPKWQHLLAQTTDGNSTRILKWFPNTNGGDPSLPEDQTPARLGPRTMTAAGDNLWVGGQFTVVNGKPQQSMVRFAPQGGQAPPVQAAPRNAQNPPAQDQNPDKSDADGNLPPTFPGGPPPDGKPNPGVDNQRAPGGAGGAPQGDKPGTEIKPTAQSTTKPSIKPTKPVT
ncbi:MAG TPA: hypothetical protein VHU91_06245, partial [Mycobacteriales bacterium]|nr:hypothetical protein [Mycobacteriales bacterium]